jgi:hypothetical protein
MPDIAEPLRPARILVTPKKFPPLRNFSCGRKGMSWEKMVNDCARSLYLGKETPTQTVVILEDANGKLIGICSFLPDARGRFVGDAQRIHIIGTDRLYHGKRLEDGSRLGDALLRGALEQIEIACDGRMPYVSALVSPGNDRSRALFERHRFRALSYPGEGEMQYLRSPHRQLPVVVLRPPAVVRRIVRKARKDSRVKEGLRAVEQGTVSMRPGIRDT